MLRNNKAKDDLACDPKAIGLHKKKGLQDPRDCELAETCQSSETFLLLPNTASSTPAGEPASQPAGQLAEQLKPSALKGKGNPLKWERNLVCSICEETMYPLITQNYLHIF